MMPTRALCFLSLLLLCPPFSAAQQPSPPAEPAPPPRQGVRVRAHHGDTIVIEGDDEVRVIRRRPAFARIVADAERALVIVVAEYLKTPEDTPTGLSDRTFGFFDIEGRSEWPLPPTWQGVVWLEEYTGSTSKERRAFLGVETPEGDLAFGGADPPFNSPSPRATTVVRFRGVTLDGGKRPFDRAQQETVAAVAKNKTRQPVRK